MIYCDLHLGHLEMKCPLTSENTRSMTNWHLGHLTSRTESPAASLSHSSSLACTSGGGGGRSYRCFPWPLFISVTTFHHQPKVFRHIPLLQKLIFLELDQHGRVRHTKFVRHLLHSRLHLRQEYTVPVYRDLLPMQIPLPV